MRARFVLSEVWQGLRRNLTMTLALIITIAVSLALFGAGLMVRQQVSQMKGFWFDKVEVSIFLCTKNSQETSCSGPASEQEKQQIAADLEAMRPLVQEVYFETSTEAYNRFQEQFQGSPIAESATPEDLGESYRVKLADPDQYSAITSAFSGRPGIERVDDQKQVLDKLFRLLDGLQMVSLAIAIAMLVVTVLLVGNTMRLAAYSRRRETGIMRLVGASKFYIQLPFLLESVIAALLGASIAVGALVVVKMFLVDRFLEPSFQFTPFVGWDTVWVVSVILVLMGVALAAIAAVLTLRRYLKV
ncbi:MAG: permease-like cell division protein FtsX [Candidatus Nanopelagicales bacterium]